MGLMDSRKAKERDLVMLAEQARQKQAQGLSQFVVHFSTGYGNSFDRRTRLDAAMETLEDLGIEVANVEDQEWEYRWTISCRNPQARGVTGGPAMRSFCPSCGAATDTTARFCSRCGNSLSPP